MKIFAFAALSGFAYSEYDSYQEHLEDYEYYQSLYNNCIDCLQEELNILKVNATNSYNLMTNHETNQNIAMLGLGSLYTWNIIEFKIKLGKR